MKKIELCFELNKFKSISFITYYYQQYYYFHKSIENKSLTSCIRLAKTTTLEKDY